MNTENLDFLKERLFFLGFGDNLNKALEEKIKNQEEKFNLNFPAEFENNGTKKVVDYQLELSKSKQQDMYFLNNFTATLKNTTAENERSQKFYLKNGSGVTAKEAFNLLEGRAVFKDKLENKDGEKYKAWLQLDLNHKDDHGNFKVQQFHEAWKYDLNKSLSKLPIKELENTTQKEQLLKSLEKGNVPQVTFTTDGREEKMFLEANPRERNLMVYDQHMHRQGQGVKKHASQEKSQSADQSQGVGGAGADGKDKGQSSTKDRESDQKKTTDKNKSEKVGVESDTSEKKQRKRGRGM